MHPLDAIEGAFDRVALTADPAAEGEAALSDRARRNSRPGIPAGDEEGDAVGIAGRVGDNGGAVRYGIEPSRGHRCITGLPGNRLKAHRATFRIDEGMDPGRRAATGMAHARIGKSPFFRRHHAGGREHRRCRSSQCRPHKPLRPRLEGGPGHRQPAGGRSDCSAWPGPSRSGTSRREDPSEIARDSVDHRAIVNAGGAAAVAQQQRLYHGPFLVRRFVATPGNLLSGRLTQIILLPRTRFWGHSLVLVMA